ncbi:hypothetical protein B0T21DRAFT_364500 [Apiosordaria backusii]|uniref:STM1-like N-terminal domain-containing protein n=1 Tax=Apiosordaria backusii TaxID=314023 RepID=A0AA40BMT5_9PEZI|nr:hypothetical protein B0T21DRAFT_364500 [Apiosordaria backusii]
MSVASKNLFAILGNDEEQPIPPPVKTVEKTSTHTAKRNTDGVAPSKGSAPSGNRRSAATGNEAAFRDRNAGRDSNRGKPTDEVRGGRRGGFRGKRPEGDRHPHRAAPHGGSAKTAEQAWGGEDGEKALNDEKAGDADAAVEKKEDEAAAPVEEQEPEPVVKTLTDFYKEQQKFEPLEPRQVKAEQFAGMVVVKRDSEDYAPGSGVKKERTRERKQKQFVEIDNRFVEPERTGGRGGRGGARDGAPRGGARGRGEGARGGARGRGGPRGGGAPRGGARDDATQSAASVAINDENAFPSLGGN